MSSLKTIQTIIKLHRSHSFKIQLRVPKFCDALAHQPLVRFTPNLVGLLLIIRSSDAVHPISDITGGYGVGQGCLNWCGGP